jgi:hypothetical protein
MDSKATYNQPTLVDLGSVVDQTLGLSINPGEVENTKALADEDI